MIQKKNPKFWARGVYLMQNGAASLWNEIAESPQYGQKWIVVKQKAIADGTFMKVPNGKPTNLTERQWLQVRTTNFKNWFGDW